MQAFEVGSAVWAGHSRSRGTPSKSRTGAWGVGGHVPLGLWTPRPVGERCGQRRARPVSENKVEV